jgi:hypothetical protein
MRLRWLWLKCTDPSRPWSCLPVKMESLVEILFAVLIVEVGNGLHSFFWTDKWIDGRSIADIAPTLPNAVRPHVHRTKTVAQGLENNAWARDITGALTVQVIIDYVLIWDVIRQRNFLHVLNLRY